MGLKRRRFTREFKRQVGRKVEARKTPARAAREYQVPLTPIVRWCKEHLQCAEQAFLGNGCFYTDGARIAE